MNLFERVSTKNRTDSKLFVGCDYQVTVNDLPGLEYAYGELLQRLAGRRVSLALQNVYQMAEALLLLDGVCAQLVLLPLEIEQEVLADFVRKTGTEIVLSDFLGERLSGLTVEKFQLNSGSPPDRLEQTTWILPTSGTTGIPKLIPHTLSSLTRTVKQRDARRGAVVWGLLYQMGRFAGLQVYLQSVLGGSTLVLPERLSLPLSKQLDLFAQHRVNALSATPTMWRKILMTSAAQKLPLELITLGGEIATQDILEALNTLYPAARLTHIYASTEFGVGFSVADREEGFPADWLNNPALGFTVNTETGELLVQLTAGDSPVGTGDRIELRGTRAVFLGRINGSINVGGNKVMPEEVERVLLSFPNVRLAAVSGIRNSIMGNLVKADIVIGWTELPLADFKKSLLEYCRNRLEPYKVPAVLNIVDQLPVSASGKIKRP